MELTGRLTAVSALSGNITSSGTLAGKITATIKSAEYTGEYEFTPTDEVQVIPVDSLLMQRDIVIKPVPQNYGHISWNGSELSVY